MLNSHPQVAESAVIAVADLIRGEEVKAYIVLKSDATLGVGARVYVNGNAAIGTGSYKKTYRDAARKQIVNG